MIQVQYLFCPCSNKYCTVHFIQVDLFGSPSEFRLGLGKHPKFGALVLSGMTGLAYLFSESCYATSRSLTIPYHFLVFLLVHVTRVVLFKREYSV
jgi:hypothetical protein